MTINFVVSLHPALMDLLTRSWADQQEVLTLVRQLTQQGANMADRLSAIQAEVAANTSAVQSVITLIDNLATQLQEAKDDPAQIQSIIDTMRTNNQALADAVVRNTPSQV